MKSRVSVIGLQHGFSILLLICLLAFLVSKRPVISSSDAFDEGVQLKGVELTLFKNSKQSATQINSDQAVLKTGHKNTVSFSGNIRVVKGAFEIFPSKIFYDRDSKECIMSGLPSFVEKKFHIKELVLKEKSDALLFNAVKLSGGIPLKNTRAFDFIEADRMMGDRSVMNLTSYFSDQVLKEKKRHKKIEENEDKKKDFKKTSPFTLSSQGVKLSLTVFYARTYLSKLVFKNSVIEIRAHTGQLKDNPTRVTLKAGGVYRYKGVEQKFKEASINLVDGVFTIPRRLSLKIAK